MWEVSCCEGNVFVYWYSVSGMRYGVYSNPTSRLYGQLIHQSLLHPTPTRSSNH
jgi:hypothetical protein